MLRRRKGFALAKQKKSNLKKSIFPEKKALAKAIPFFRVCTTEKKKQKQL